MFLLGCIIVRLAIAYLAKKIDPKYLPLMGKIALIPAIGLLYIYFTGSRKTGAEVFGEEIWWDDLRIVHAGFYLIFSCYAHQKKEFSYVPLLCDALFGLGSFLVHHKNLIIM